MDEVTYGEIEQLLWAIGEMSQTFIRDLGDFLPHGAHLGRDGTITLVGATPEGGEEMSSWVEVLPLLHAGLRLAAAEPNTLAVAVSESVQISEDNKTISAIKVLLEHRNGQVLALYQPYKKGVLGRYKFMPTKEVEHAAEVGGWV